MGAKTGIGWTDATWNPWMGCHKVSQGCKNCYMFREQKQYGNDPNIVRVSKTTFDAPRRWSEPRRIFTCSWSDWFIEEADEWRKAAWDIIRVTSQHTYQILTKRPERIKSCLPKDWGKGYPNVWLGVTGETQEDFDKRIIPLLDIPAAVHFVSIEPMLGPIDISPELFPWMFGPVRTQGIDWVICGCESGPGARVTDIDWIRDLRDRCVEMDEDGIFRGVPFFLKQMMIDGKLVREPFLDGRQWLEFPTNQGGVS